jgi:4-amino-4-deoxy-L-arabinose transferase-like glycosyltransferase
MNSAPGTVKKNIPALVSSAILIVIVMALVSVSVNQNQGHVVYALDDPYIHMSIAKNFSQHGIWGITKHGFTSSSSSILWTLLLSLTYFLFGVSEISPLILNLIACILIFFLASKIMEKHQIPPLLMTAVFASVILFTPLPALVLCGQEHTLHILIALAFLNLAGTLISGNEKKLSMLPALVILAVLLTIARYEGLFMVFAACLLLILKKKTGTRLACRRGGIAAGYRLRYCFGFPGMGISAEFGHAERNRTRFFQSQGHHKIFRLFGMHDIVAQSPRFGAGAGSPGSLFFPVPESCTNH